MIKVLATICSLTTGDCMEKIVTTSDQSYVSMVGCQVAAPQLAEWMRQYPNYRLAGWKCQIGDRQKLPV